MRRGILWMSVSALALLGCGGSGGTGSDTAQSLAQYEGPIESTDVVAGEQAFNEMCGSCHGDGASGPSLADMALPAAQVRQQVREGEAKMPPIPESKLSNTDLEHVLAYLASINGVDAGGAAPAGGDDMAGDDMAGDDMAGDDDLEGI